MIDSLTLKNFQSHQESHVQFHPGINAITGESDNGKTAILRALYWARYNKPSGDNFVSKWARNDKGKQKEDTSVTITKGKNTLTRGKGKGLNGYQINDHDPLQALGKGGLPVDVENFFDMNDVNIQQQMDTPFLLGQKPSDIAKFLNSIVDMTEIDTYLSLIDSKKRSTNKDLKRAKEEVTQLEQELLSYENLSLVESKLNKLSKVSTRKNKYSEQCTNIADSISNYKVLIRKATVPPSVTKLYELLDKVAPVLKKQNDTLKTYNKLSSSISEYNGLSQILCSTPPSDKIKPLLKDISDVLTKKSEAQKKLKALDGLITLYCKSKKAVNRLDIKILELENHLPDTCPTCGQYWELCSES